MQRRFARLMNWNDLSEIKRDLDKTSIAISILIFIIRPQHISPCLLLRRFDSEAGEAGELEARETGYEHARDHGKENEARRNACKNSCRFLANFVVFLTRYFSRVFKP